MSNFHNLIVKYRALGYRNTACSWMGIARAFGYEFAKVHGREPTREDICHEVGHEPSGGHIDYNMYPASRTAARYILNNRPEMISLQRKIKDIISHMSDEDQARLTLYAVWNANEQKAEIRIKVKDLLAQSGIHRAA